MQMLHPHCGSIQQYMEELSDADRYRPSSCPLCQAKRPLIAHGFYNRTIVDVTLDGVIRVRRYLCRLCQRTVSLLPEWALPYLRVSIPIVACFLKARLLNGQSLKASAEAAGQPTMPYQRGQHWIRRFKKQAVALSVMLVALTAAITASSFISKALSMLETVGWISAHRFLFRELRAHLLGWPRSLVHEGRSTILVTAWGSGGSQTHTICMEPEVPSS